jgi:hypothetical protein
MKPIISIALFSSSVKLNPPAHETLGRTSNVFPFWKDRVTSQQHFIRFSKPFWSGELGESRYENEFDDLSFLPIESFNDLHPETLSVLKKVSRLFVESSIKPDIKVDIKEVLDMLESVYNLFPSREVTINNQKIEVEEAREVLSVVLGFCALLRIPNEITTIVLEGVLTIPEMHKSSKYVDIFKEKGWSCIEFKKGLPIRLKRKHMSSIWSKLAPRGGIFRNSRDVEYASIAVYEASKTKAPPKRMKKQEIEARLNEIGSRLGNTDFQIEEIKFFPHQSPALKLIRRFSRTRERVQIIMNGIIKNQTHNLQKTGNTGLVSYALLNCFFLYASALWSWKELIKHTSNGLATYDMNSIIIFAKKCLKVILAIFVGSKLSQIPRLYLATFMASVVNRNPLFFQRKISTKAKDRAIRIVKTSSLFLLLGFWYQLQLKRGLG